jgi:hypothetical protein
MRRFFATFDNLSQERSMANAAALRIRKPGVKPGVTAKNGQAVHNKILLALPAKERSAVLEIVEFISLPTHSVLHEADATITFAYFPNEGLASVLNVMSDGKSVEVGLLGTDGFVGTPLVAGYDHVFARSGKDSRPQQTGRGLLRMLWNDRAANEEMAG